MKIWSSMWQRRSILGYLCGSALLVACGGAQTPGASNGGESAGGSEGLVGKKAPEIIADEVGGDGPKNLADASGQITIVDFWATFCDPCRKSFPKYQEMVDKYAGKLVVIAVSVDDPEDATLEDVKGFAEELSVTFPIVWDKEKKTAEVYKPPKMPTSYIVDQKGIVRHIHAGYTAEEADVIMGEVDKLLE
jgi:thiol-disulfide isomerase/thioredoxin